MDNIIPLRPTYEFHPFSTIWPLLEGDDFDKLALDIAANGLKLPILLYQGKILDGRNRYRGCIESGVEPRFEQAHASNNDEALNLVVSLNDHRRHLSYEQRAFAAARLANLKAGSNQFVNQKVSSKELTSENDYKYKHHATSVLEASKLMDVTTAATKRAKAVIEYGGAELEKEVIQRKVKLTNAVDQVRPKRALNGKAAPRVKRAYGVPPASRVPVVDISKRRLLSPQQVDPEFTGSSQEFTSKYGHVQIETAEERAAHRFAEWTLHIRKWAREYKEFPLSEVDVNWLRSPRDKDVDRFLEAYATLDLVFENIRSIRDKAQELKDARRQK